MKSMKALLGEFMVTYLFFSAAYNSGTALGVALAAVGLIYAFGGISGAHFNPAVTVGALIGGKIDVVQGILYIVLHLIAGVAAAATFHFTKGVVLVPNVSLKDDMIRSLSLEVLTTFILVFVIYAVAMGVNTDSKSLDGDNSEREAAKAKLNFAPIAIGFTLGFLCFFEHASFNPAAATGPFLYKLMTDYEHFGFNQLAPLGIIWAGDLVGAAVAALLWNFFFAA